MRYIAILLILCGSLFAEDAVITHGTGATGTIVHHGITWTFDKNLQPGAGDGTHYQCGLYVTGDAYIVGPVNITAIDPAPALSSTRYINGSMINPDAGAEQGFDSSVSGFTLSRMKGLSADLPLTVATNSSFISSDSKTTAAQRPFMDHMAILTVVVAAPASGAFRPPYVGTTKTSSFNETDLEITGDAYNHLAKCAVVAGTGQVTPTTTAMSEPWIMFRPASYADYIALAYGSDLAITMGGVAMMLNSNYTNAQKRTPLIWMVQLGIDLKSIVDQNVYALWYNDGGKANGRKLPILFSGLILNDAGMLAIGNKSGDYIGVRTYPNRTSEIPADYVHYGEDDQTFVVSVYDVGMTSPLLTGNTWSYHCSVAISGAIAVGHTVTQATTGASGTITGIDISGDDWVGILWNGSGSDFDCTHGYVVTDQVSAGSFIPDNRSRWTIGGAWHPDDRDNYKIPYTSDDYGRPEWGIRNATLPNQSNNYRETSYRTTSGKCFPIQALVARIMGLKTAWNHDVFFDYTDIYMDPSYRNTVNAWTCALWDEYRWDDWGIGVAVSHLADGNVLVTEGTTIQVTFSATGGTGPYTWTYSTLPGVSTFNHTTGVLDWITTTSEGSATPYSVTITATDSTPVTPLVGTQTVTITVNDVPSPDEAVVLDAIPDQEIPFDSYFSYQCVATNATTWTLTGNPSTLSINNVGLITGTLTSPGRWSTITVKAANTTYNMSKTFSMDITPFDGPKARHSTPFFK